MPPGRLLVVIVEYKSDVMLTKKDSSYYERLASLHCLFTSVPIAYVQNFD